MKTPAAVAALMEPIDVKQFPSFLALIDIRWLRCLHSRSFSADVIRTMFDILWLVLLDINIIKRWQILIWKSKENVYVSTHQLYLYDDVGLQTKKERIFSLFFVALLCSSSCHSVCLTFTSIFMWNVIIDGICCSNWSKEKYCFGMNKKKNRGFSCVIRSSYNWLVK